MLDDDTERPRSGEAPSFVDELDDDEPVSALELLAAKSPSLQKLLTDLARNDIARWEAEQAERQRAYAALRAGPDPSQAEPVAEPKHPRARKRHQRKRLFEALRDGYSRETACHLAGVPLSLFDQWMQRERFAESVGWAEDRAIESIGNPLR